MKSHADIPRSATGPIITLATLLGTALGSFITL